MVKFTYIIKAIDETIKCSDIVKSSPYYQVAMEMCDKYGLELVKCNKTQLRFRDSKDHNNPLNDRIKSTEIRFDDFLDKDSIDFSNSLPNGEVREPWGRDRYNLDRVLEMYETLPNSLKRSASMIIFGNKWNNCTLMYDSKYKCDNVVYLTRDAFDSGDSQGRHFNLERIMAHELGHCFEMGKLTPNEQKIYSKITNGKASNSDKEYFNEKIIPKMHTYSREGGLFWKACEKQSGGWGIDMSITSGYALHYFLTHEDNPNLSLGEHFAETVSMVSFKNKESKNNASLKFGMYSGETEAIPYDKFVKNNKVLFDETDKLLND